MTVVQTHKGDWKLLHSPDDSIHEQQQEFRKLLGNKSHADYAVVILQESTGLHQRRTFLSPKDAEAEDLTLANQHKAHVEQGEKNAKAAQVTQAEIDKRQQEAHKAIVSAHSKTIEASIKEFTPAKKK